MSPAEGAAQETIKSVQPQLNIISDKANDLTRDLKSAEEKAVAFQKELSEKTTELKAILTSHKQLENQIQSLKNETEVNKKQTEQLRNEKSELILELKGLEEKTLRLEKAMQEETIITGGFGEAINNNSSILALKEENEKLRAQVEILENVRKKTPDQNKQADFNKRFFTNTFIPARDKIIHRWKTLPLTQRKKEILDDFYKFYSLNKTLSQKEMVQKWYQGYITGHPHLEGNENDPFKILNSNRREGFFAVEITDSMKLLLKYVEGDEPSLSGSAQRIEDTPYL